METFFKYHGLGNDFVVVDRRATGVDVEPAQAIRWCDRHFGIGADGVLAVLPEPGTAGRMVVHNADGSIAEMCGNGLRCVVKFLAEAQGNRPETLKVATGAGVLDCELVWSAEGVDTVTVAMGPARLEAPILPFGGPFVAQPVDGLIATAVSMGNPHLVFHNAGLDLAATRGPVLEHDARFVQRTNVEFVVPRAEGGLEVVVWERGVGLTLACGTGACASVAAWALAGKVSFDEWVPVKLPGGLLDIKVKRDLSMVWLRGPVRFVYRGAAL